LKIKYQKPKIKNPCLAGRQEIPGIKPFFKKLKINIKIRSTILKFLIFYMYI